MAYQLHYWELGPDSETHYELKCVRLKSINEAYPLSLAQNRPLKTVLVTVDRTDNQSVNEKIIWEK